MAHLLVIELPGGNDLDMLRAAVERGDRFSFVTADLAHYRRQPALAAALSLAQACLEVPGLAADALLDAVQALHRQHPIDAVLCLVEIRIVEAALLAESLHLPHISPRCARLVRDKFSVRQVLQAAGFPQPDHALATSTQDLHAAVRRLGLPLIIKPSDGYGSQNIVSLCDPVDLDPLLSPLDELLPSRNDYGLGVAANDRLLVERQMHGRVIACDTLSLGGRHRLLGINEKCFFDAPSFAIRGGVFRPYTPATREEFEPLAAHVFGLLDAIGFDCGATHTELMLTDQGPQLIEINPRLVGARLPRLISAAWQHSLHQDLIEVHLGRWPQARDPRLARCAAMRWFAAPAEGRLAGVQRPTGSAPTVCCAELLKRPGDCVRPPLENADRLGYVIATGDSPAQAESLAEAYVQAATVHLLAESAAAPPPSARRRVDGGLLHAGWPA